VKQNANLNVNVVIFFDVTFSDILHMYYSDHVFSTKLLSIISCMTSCQMTLLKNYEFILDCKIMSAATVAD